MSEARRGNELSVMNPKSRITVTGPLDHAPRSLVNVAWLLGKFPPVKFWSTPALEVKVLLLK